MALSIVLVVCHRGWQLPFFRPRSLVGLQENVCLPDEELFQGLCYMRCSILTNGNAPYRQSASECCKDSNFFCLFMGNTKSPYFGMGGGQSPPTTAAHAPKVGGICDADGHGSEESFNGLCYKKCSVLTGGKFPVRVNPTECCGGGTLECLSGKGNVSGNAEFGAGVHAPGEEKSEMTARSRMSMLCLPNEEEYLGNCYQKCSQLSEGKAAHAHQDLLSHYAACGPSTSKPNRHIMWEPTIMARLPPLIRLASVFGAATARSRLIRSATRSALC